MGHRKTKTKTKESLIKGLYIAIIVLFFALGTSFAAGPTSKLNTNVKEFTLKNGMMFLVVERHTTPQVACRLAIRAGSALEEAGKTGIAHLLEHMMFKGTKNFGTLDAEKDQELQAKIERAYQAVKAEQQKRSPNRELIREKLEEMNKLRSRVQEIYVPQAFSMQLQKNGAVGVNAFTSKDQTQFTASVPSDMIEQWFSIISEQVFEPSWREFYVEKEVVQREWAFRYVNNPEGAAWLDLNATAYSAHPYRNPVIGWKSDMEMYSTADAMAYHKKYYSPSNSVCVLVGDITVDEARNLAEIYFERYPAGRRAPEIVTREPEQVGPRKSVRYLKGARKPIVMIGFHGAKMGTRDFYALDAINMILSTGHSARMKQAIEEMGLAQDVWSWNPDTRYGGIFVLGGSPNEPGKENTAGLSEAEMSEYYLKACEDLQNILVAQVDKLKDEFVPVAELRRIKKLSQIDFLRSLRSNEKLATKLANFEVQVGWGYITSYIDEIASITPKDIREVAKKYFNKENMTSVYVIPGGKAVRPPVEYQEIRSATGSSEAVGVEVDLEWNRSIYPTPKGWKHPLSFKRKPKRVRYQEAKTAEVNGTKVFYIRNQELPLIDVTFLVKAGAVDVAQKKTGLSDLLGKCIIRGGTEKYKPKDLALELDENAIDLSVSVSEEETIISLSLIKGDWEKGVSILEEMLARPRFDSEIVKVVKEELLNKLKRQGGDARAVLKRELDIQQFKGHPYGRDPILGLKTIPGITREDLFAFLKRYVVPSNMVVTVAGDIELSEALQGLKKILNSLPEHKAPARKLNDPPDTSPVLAFVNKPGQIQSHVGMAIRGMKRDDPNFWKMDLLLEILGGSDSLMFKRLRDDLGLVYVAGFYQTYKWQAGVLKGYIAARGPKTRRAIEETLKIMDGLCENVPEAQLEQKRLDVLNSFVFNLDNPDDLVKAYGRYYLRKEPLNTLDRIQEIFITAKKDELVSLAKKYFNISRLQIVVVGDKSIEVRKENGYGVTLEEDLKRLAWRLGLPFKEIPLR